MTAAAHTRHPSASRLPRPPAPSVALTSLAARRFDLSREIIVMPCGRIIEREQALLPRVSPAGASAELRAWYAARPSHASESTYRLWEPVEGNTYGTTRADKKGQRWGLAHTRRAPNDTGYGDAVAWEMAQQRRANELIVASCRELQGEGVRRNCGIISLFGTLEVIRYNVEQAAHDVRGAV